MSYRMQEPCNPEGWQTVAGGRSGAETPGRQAVGLHPGGMPEFCDPSRVGMDYRVDDPGVSLRSTPGYCLARLQLGRAAIPSRTFAAAAAPRLRCSHFHISARRAIEHTRSA